MEIYVNGNSLEFSLDNETEFGPVFTGITDWVAQGNKRIWSIQIDGTPYEAAKPEAFSDMAVADISRVDISVGDKDAGKEMVNRVEGFKVGVKTAIGLIEPLVSDVHQGNDQAMQEKWQHILHVINGFHQVLPILADINIGSDKATLTQDYDEFRDVLKEIYKTQELRDNVAFCDQLLYELKPQLEKWQDFLTITRSSIKKG